MFPAVSYLYWLRLKEKALRAVRTHCLLVKEEVSSGAMVTALKNTSVAEWKGETLQTLSEHHGFISSVIGAVIWTLLPCLLNLSRI